MQHHSFSQTQYEILEADKQGEGDNQHHLANVTNRANKANTQVSGHGELGTEFRGSLDEWLQPLPSCQELEVEIHYFFKEICQCMILLLCVLFIFFSYYLCLPPFCLFLFSVPDPIALEAYI
jgi:hypothetical protein